MEFQNRFDGVSGAHIADKARVYPRSAGNYMVMWDGYEVGLDDYDNLCLRDADGLQALIKLSDRAAGKIKMLEEQAELMYAPLRELRERLGLSQAQLAEELGIDPNTWARRERGELDNNSTVYHLAIECLMRRRGLL